MTMRTFAAIALAAALFIGHATFAATQQDFDDCSQTDDVARSAAACSRVVASPEASAADRAAALIQLGNDDTASGKLDEAIADYSGAIQLDPKSTLAYAARAIAYWRKNDRDRAVADYNQAAAIDASELHGMAIVNAELGAIGQFADERLQQANDTTPISARALLDEMRERLYELNFDPGSLDGPAADAMNEAIREFEQKKQSAADRRRDNGLAATAASGRRP
jgi:tetratricopeptide (TPR) repeat protein